jgi:Holliday junction resolvase
VKIIARDPFKHEIIELLAAHGQLSGFKLGDPSSEKTFIEIVRKSVKANQSNDILLYGRRTEAMFSYVAAALGECDLIKTEDSGRVIAANTAIAIPDYRLFLKGGRQMLVEVKNKHGERLVLRKAYVDRLTTYARLTQCDLKIAVYWSQHNRWSLLDPARIPLRFGQYALEAIESM